MLSRKDDVMRSTSPKNGSLRNVSNDARPPRRRGASVPVRLMKCEEEEEKKRFCISQSVILYLKSEKKKKEKKKEKKKQRGARARSLTVRIAAQHAFQQHRRRQARSLLSCFVPFLHLSSSSSSFFFSRSGAHETSVGVGDDDARNNSSSSRGRRRRRSTTTKQQKSATFSRTGAGDLTQRERRE